MHKFLSIILPLFFADAVLTPLAIAQISFQTPLSSGTLGGPVALLTADFNGDGIADVAVSDVGSQVVAISLGKGDGTFQQTATYPIATSCALASLYIADFTGDHKPDLFGFCVFGAQVVVLPGKGDGTFGAAIYSPLPVPAFAGDIPLLGLLPGLTGAVGDFNADGALDLVVAATNDLSPFPPQTRAFFLPGKGDGTFGTAVPITQQNQALAFVAGDFNGDGKLDLAYLTAQGMGTFLVSKKNFEVVNQTLAIALGNGNGTFQTPVTYPWPGAIATLAAADLNGDGFLDLYSAGVSPAASGHDLIVSSVIVMLGDGKGNFKQGFTANDPMDELPVSFCLADFTGTGGLDLEETFADVAGFTGGPTGVNTLFGLRLGDGKGGFGTLQTFSGPMGIYPFISVCADFNGDGIADLAYSGLPVAGLIAAFAGITSVQNIEQEMERLPAGTLYISLNSNPAPARTFGNTNAASFASGPLAPNSIATAFWAGPDNVSGIGLNVQDSAGQTRAAQIFFVNSTQINYLIPDGTALGPATVSITGAPNPFSAPLKIVAVAPGVFQAGGFAVGDFDTVDASGNQTLKTLVVADASGTLHPVPIDVTAGEVFLTIFGTGIRNHANPVTAMIGSVTLPTAFAGAQGQFFGEDQINIQLPATLAGSGLVNVTLNVDGQTSNTVQIQIN